ncbi:MAG: hypothetical protein ACLFQW_11845, partial [Spirochaetaceae bacterium]
MGQIPAIIFGPGDYRAPGWEFSDFTFDLLREYGFSYSSNMLNEDIRMDKSFGIGVQALGPTVIASGYIDLFLSPHINLEAGFNLLVTYTVSYPSGFSPRASMSARSLYLAVVLLLRRSSCFPKKLTGTCPYKPP